MIRYLTVKEVLEVHRRIIEQYGGPTELRDLAALEAALAQVQMTFDGEELYPTV